MTEPELTPEARDAIRAYMLKLVIPSAAILTIVAGALGFVVSGLAQIDASATSAEHARAAAEKAIEAAADAKNSTLRAAEAAKNSDDAYAVLLKAKTQTDQLLTGQYDSFSQALFATKGFREAIGKLGDQQVKDINAKIDSLAVTLKQWGNPRIYERGNASEPNMDAQFDGQYGRKAECQTPGMYMTGVETIMDRPNGHIWGFRIVCRPLSQ